MVLMAYEREVPLGIVYALSGEANGQFRFNLLIGARIGEITYT